MSALIDVDRLYSSFEYVTGIGKGPSKFWLRWELKRLADRVHLVAMVYKAITDTEATQDQITKFAEDVTRIYNEPLFNP